MLIKELNQYKQGEPCFVKRKEDTQYVYGIFNRIEKDNPKGIIRCLDGNYDTILPYFENFRKLRKSNLIDRYNSRFCITPQFLIKENTTYGFYVGNQYKDIFEKELQELWKFYIGHEFTIKTPFICSEKMNGKEFGHLKAIDEYTLEYETETSYEENKDKVIYSCFSKIRCAPDPRVYQYKEGDKLLAANYSSKRKTSYCWKIYTFDYYNPCTDRFIFKEWDEELKKPESSFNILPYKGYEHLVNVPTEYIFGKENLKKYLSKKGIKEEDFISVRVKPWI